MSARRTLRHSLASLTLLAGSMAIGCKRQTCDAGVLQKAVDQTSRARDQWSPEDGRVADQASASVEAVRGGCSGRPRVLEFALLRTDLISDPTQISGGPKLTAEDWDSVAPEICPGLVGHATEGARGPELYEKCGLTPASGLTEGDFVAAGGSILTVALLKLRHWLSEKSDPKTAEVLTARMLERWRWETWVMMNAPELDGNGDRIQREPILLPSTNNGTPLSEPFLLVTLHGRHVRLDGGPVGSLDFPQIADVLRDDVAKRRGDGTQSLRDAPVLVAVDRNTSIAVLRQLAPAIVGADGAKLGIVALGDDVDNPMRLVELDVQATAATKSVQEAITTPGA